MAEVKQSPQAEEPRPEDTGDGAVREGTKDGKGGLVAAGVTAAVLGGAAVAVGVARSRESQAWSRLQDQMLGGAGSRSEAGSLERPLPQITLPQMLRRTADRCPQHPALAEKVVREWVPTTYAQLWERVMHFALGLAELGVGKGDRVAILSENRIEWAIADLAALSLGGVTVPVYATL